MKDESDTEPRYVEKTVWIHWSAPEEAEMLNR